MLTMTTILTLLLLFLSALSLSKPSLSAGVFLSIDCGASDSSKDANSITWTGDDAYIQTGISQLTQLTLDIPYVMSTLRAFPTRKKNCYSINVDKSDRILVRATFYYGNYDRNLSPPIFDLQFDGNYWATVNFTSTYDVVSHETIYLTNKNTTSICVAQTQPGQTPFMSTLEVRSLGVSMYGRVGPNHALFLDTRGACGADNSVRYSADVYDRIWTPKNGILLTTVRSDALAIDVSTTENKPPATVLQNAVTTAGTLQYVVVYTNLPAKTVPIYMVMYFSEVSRINSTDKRSIQVYIDNKPSSDNIVPPYGGVSEVHFGNLTASSSTSISVVAASDSTLPPLINAFEVYVVSEALTEGTYSKDVEGLAALQSKFSILQSWNGDPCLPSPYTWDWVECSADTPPRVTALYLSSFGLSGVLPDFSLLDALQTIDLHNNSIDGPIPNFLGNLPNLQLLNLADNRLSGPIPSSLSKNNKLKLVVTGNCFNETPCRATNPSTGVSPEAPAPSTRYSGQNQNNTYQFQTPFPGQFQNETPSSSDANKITGSIVLSWLFWLLM